MGKGLTRAENGMKSWDGTGANVSTEIGAGEGWRLTGWIMWRQKAKC
jgi:hypothetical protein